MNIPYPPELSKEPFYIACPGTSIAETNSQFIQDLKRHIPEVLSQLTPRGIDAIRAMPPVLAAAGVAVRRVCSSVAPHAQQSAAMLAQHYEGVLEVSEPMVGLEEISVKDEPEDNLEAARDSWRSRARRYAQTLRNEGLQNERNGYIPWVVPMGRGVSPLAGALQGIRAIEERGLQPGDLVFGHPSVNCYMEAIATSVPSTGRERIANMAGAAAMIGVLDSYRTPFFAIADNARNKQQPGAVTKYTVDLESGLWIAGRRIELPEPGQNVGYVPYRRAADGMWMSSL